MRFFFVSLFCLLFSIHSSAQQAQSWTSFYEVGFLWNPALTAKWNSWELSSTVRKEWTGFENSPESGNISFQYPVIKRQTVLSFGGYIDYDKVGPHSQGSIAGSMAYKIRPRFFGNRDDVLSLGGSLSLQNRRFDPTTAKAFDGINGDRNLTINSSSSFSPGLSLGTYYMSVSDFYSFKSHYYFGLSANQIIPSKLEVGEAGVISNVPNFTMHTGYRYFPKRSPYYIEPNIFVNYSLTNAMLVMGNVRYEKVNSYWFSVGAVSNGAVFGQIGFIFNDQSFLGSLVKDGMLRIGTKIDYRIAGIGPFAGMGYEAYVAYVFENE